jgi:D-arabinose 1-dehydrogenase-like Zn-dependent alcohol dehydrogenase
LRARSCQVGNNANKSQRHALAQALACDHNFRIVSAIIMASQMQNYGLLREEAGRAVLKAIPVPQVPDDYILVRTVAIALNPTDWTTLDAVGDPGTIMGCDYAGIVEEIGKSVQKTFKKGDRVAGFGHGGLCPACSVLPCR